MGERGIARAKDLILIDIDVEFLFDRRFDIDLTEDAEAFVLQCSRDYWNNVVERCIDCRGKGVRHDGTRGCCSEVGCPPEYDSLISGFSIRIEGLNGLAQQYNLRLPPRKIVGLVIYLEPLSGWTVSVGCFLGQPVTYFSKHQPLPYNHKTDQEHSVGLANILRLCRCECPYLCMG